MIESSLRDASPTATSWCRVIAPTPSTAAISSAIVVENGCQMDPMTRKSVVNSSSMTSVIDLLKDPASTPTVETNARQCIKVDLPEPEGPITAVNSPAYRSRLTPSRARTSDAPEP